MYLKPWNCSRLVERLTDARRLERGPIDAAIGAAGSKLAINGHRRNGTDAEIGCALGNLLIMEIQYRDIARVTGDLLHHLNNVVADRALRTEDFYISLAGHHTSPVVGYLIQ
jgi:hypothetical protein